jgi:MFS family permease
MLFATYGLYIAATEGTSKALIGRAIPTGQRASALGLYSTATGLATFAASTVGGLLWSAYGAWATFAYGAAAALVAAVLMLAGRGRVRSAFTPAPVPCAADPIACGHDGQGRGPGGGDGSDVRRLRARQ